MAQIELLEPTSSVFRYPNFDEYILRKQYEEANALDDIRLGEYEIHIFGKTQKAFLKWSEGSDGSLEFKGRTPGGGESMQEREATVQYARNYNTNCDC